MKETKLLNGMILLLAITFVFGCKSPEALMEIGEYDAAVIKAVEKLRKQKRKKEKHIIVVEDAFRKITAKDLRRIEALKGERNDKNWIEINSIHKKIQRRQELIDNYLPLIANNGYKADFRFVKVNAMELNSRKRAADYLYRKGKALMASAEDGNKLAARSAHSIFLQLEQYDENHKDAHKLRSRALDLGTNKMLFVVKNTSFGFFPRRFEEELLSFNENRLDDHWNVYYTSRSQSDVIDYKVVVDIRDIDVSPELLDERAFRETKQITVEVPVRPTAIQRQKRAHSRDSLEQELPPSPTTKKINKQIFADILQIRQSKSAMVSADILFYDDSTQRLINSETLNAESVFENLAATFKGDRRAVSSAVAASLGGNPVAFPSDEVLVLEAADHLKNDIAGFIKRADEVVMR